MSKLIRKSALLKTSAASDVKRSGGKVAITGCKEFSLRNLLSAKQIVYKAEVVQIAKTGQGSYTPTGGTKYTIMFINPAFEREGSKMVQEKKYSFVTNADITVHGGTAALQREAIHVALAALINADGKNFVSAATAAGGTGLNITDDANYYTARVGGASNGREGATGVKALTNADGSGFVDSTATTITTAAVYAEGVGARMIQDNPVYHNFTGNLISGEVEAPIAVDGTFATSGQQYDRFSFQLIADQNIPAISNIFGFQLSEINVFVDNGKGSSVTNLAGFKAFEREAKKVIASIYEKDTKSTIQFFDKPFVMMGLAGAANGVDAALGTFVSTYGGLNVTAMNTQTIIAPILDATGMLLDQDLTATDGAHYSAPESAISPQEFVVGQEEFSVTARVVMADWTDASFMLGFRKKAVYTHNFIDYTDAATIGNGSSAAGTTFINGDLIATTGTLNNAATVATISAVAPTDAVSVEFRINVAIDGTVTAYADNVSYPIYSVGTTTLILDAGDSMIPFFQTVNIAGGTPGESISELVAVNAIWKL